MRLRVVLTLMLATGLSGCAMVPAVLDSSPSGSGASSDRRAASDGEWNRVRLGAVASVSMPGQVDSDKTVSDDLGRRVTILRVRAHTGPGAAVAYSLRTPCPIQARMAGRVLLRLAEDEWRERFNGQISRQAPVKTAGLSGRQVVATFQLAKLPASGIAYARYVATRQHVVAIVSLGPRDEADAVRRVFHRMVSSFALADKSPKLGCSV